MRIIYYSIHVIRRILEDKQRDKYCKDRVVIYLDGTRCPLCPWVNECRRLANDMMKGCIVK